jgi:hypothetical protein
MPSDLPSSRAADEARRCLPRKPDAHRPCLAIDVLDARRVSELPPPVDQRVGLEIHHVWIDEVAVCLFDSNQQTVMRPPDHSCFAGVMLVAFSPARFSHLSSVAPKGLTKTGFSVKPAICRATRRSRDTGGPQIMPPRGGATATACWPLGPELLRSLAELAFDLRLGEKAGEGGVRDGVVGGERP